MTMETTRLILREMTQNDLQELSKILQDKDVMYAYEHPFSIQEVITWLEKQLENYKEYGFGLWAVILKESGNMIGQCGLTMQDYKNRKIVEIGYLFNKEFWHKGYATEAAIACKEYAFKTLRLLEVYSIIRENNISSQKVAIRNGMIIKDRIIKHYYGIDMPHLVYYIQNHHLDKEE